MIKTNNLSDLYQEIKHRGRILTKEEVKEILSLLDQPYNKENDIFSSSVLCLSLGSDYIEKHPHFLKEFFNYNLYDDDVEELFRAIQYSNTMIFYIDEIQFYSTLETYLNGLELACSGALNAFGAYIYKHKDKNRYKLLYEYFNFSLRVLDQTNGKDERNELMEYLKFCYYALLKSLYGKESARMPFTIQEILEEGISLPKELP
jgi:hypothetical protein